MGENIFIKPLNNIQNEKCNCENCQHDPEIKVNFFKRKEENELVGKSIELYFCKQHFIEYKEQFLKKYERLEKYFTLLAEKERDIAHLQLKMENGEELE